MRHIPATMATQHPDNAAAPFWDEASRPFISVYKEISEAVANFQQLGVSECMWDWEGKHADAAIIDRLFTEYHDYFNKHQLGRDKFLTFRIPNIWEEKGYNLMQAMTVMLSSEDFARDLKFAQRPLFEVILPMTERADQVMHMQQLFQKLAQFKSSDFTPNDTPNMDYMELIPLVESVESQQGAADLLREYVELHKQHFKHQPEYIRLFLACSDPALAAGHLATVVANKVALSDLAQLSDELGIAVYPIMGPGSLPFRGGLAPNSIKRFMTEYPGVRTVTVQSAFRYDHPQHQVAEAIAQLEETLPQTEPERYSADARATLVRIAAQSEEYYQATLQSIAADMQPIFAAFPKRRDRRQHIGLLSYGRSVGEHSLPRAITFTGGFYSLGVPPEFIGLGRTLQGLNESDLATLREYYVHITENLTLAGHYLNRTVLDKLAAQNEGWQAVQTDVAAVEQVLGITLGAATPEQQEHQRLSAEIFAAQTDKTRLTELISQTALLRKALG